MSTINLVTEIPGPKSQALNERRAAAIAQGNAKLTSVAIQSAQGAAVLDVDGNTLLDFAGGIVVHETAGLAALILAIFLGARKIQTKPPHNPVW